MKKDLMRMCYEPWRCKFDLWYKRIYMLDLILGPSISGSVRFWTKINNQTNLFFLIFWTEPNRTENQFKLINFGSVRFGFFPFQTGSNRNYSNLFTVPKKSLIPTSKKATKNLPCLGILMLYASTAHN
jgi:hypothetical protein